MKFPVEEYNRLLDVYYILRDARSMTRLQDLGRNMWQGYLACEM